MELIHRTIPYPVLLVSEQTDAFSISAAHKRWSMGEAGKMVLDDSVILCELTDESRAQQFLANLALTAQPRNHLFSLYQGWMDCLEAFKSSLITGLFIRPSDKEMAVNRHEALREYERLIRQIAALRAKATHESQMNRRVDLNLKIQSLETELANARSHL
jgi:hypothetical protein